MKDDVDALRVRSEWIVRLTAAIMTCGIGASLPLWLASRTYPLVPLFSNWHLPVPFDGVLLAVFVAALGVFIFRPHERIVHGIIVLGFVTLIALDIQRLYPSFYMYALILGCWIYGRTLERVKFVSLVQIILALIYVWAGVYKANPFFMELWRWLVGDGWLVVFGYVAPLFEVTLGVALLSVRLRKIAVAGLVIMHGIIAFEIGPLREGWNMAAWWWNASTAVLLLASFTRIPRDSYRTLFGKIRPSLLAAMAGFLIFGPFLGLYGYWDAALSFNVYTGNHTTGSIVLGRQDLRRVPESLTQYIEEREGGIWHFRLRDWSLHSFGGGPYAEARVYRSVFRSLCQRWQLSPDATLHIHPRYTLGSVREDETIHCDRTQPEVQ